jgi:ABC-2 type transport system ATP-binding protein
MPAISFQNVSKTYFHQRNKDTVVHLDDVSGHQGGRVWLLGPMALAKPPDQHPCRPCPARRQARFWCMVTTWWLITPSRDAAGVVPQELVFDPFFTVREALRIQSGYFGVKKRCLD